MIIHAIVTGVLCPTGVIRGVTWCVLSIFLCYLAPVFCPLLGKKGGEREIVSLCWKLVFYFFPFSPRRLCGAVGARVEGGRLCVLILSCSVILLLLIEGNCVCVCVLGCVCVRLSVRVHTQSARACLNVHVCVWARVHESGGEQRSKEQSWAPSLRQNSHSPSLICSPSASTLWSAKETSHVATTFYSANDGTRHLLCVSITPSSSDSERAAPTFLFVTEPPAPPLPTFMTGTRELSFWIGAAESWVHRPYFWERTSFSYNLIVHLLFKGSHLGFIKQSWILFYIFNCLILPFCEVL